MQTQFISDLSSIHGVRQILLVGEDEKQRIPELVLVQHPLQLLAGLNDTVTIVAVDDEDDALCVLEVMPPQRPDLVLSAHVPHGELDVLVFDSLDIEAYISCEHQHADSWHSRIGCWEDAPMVGMVVTISPSFSLYKIVVFPAASKPTIRILISFLPQRRSNNFENVRPILAGCEGGEGVRGGVQRGKCGRTNLVS